MGRDQDRVSEGKGRAVVRESIRIRIRERMGKGRVRGKVEEGQGGWRNGGELGKGKGRREAKVGKQKGCQIVRRLYLVYEVMLTIECPSSL